ncbi:MAG: hypothetical protein LBU70_10080 [Chitinispirillales bacterium]|jgi:hypothetical protein|nr:hypothetical protein [Chitinispirillales bacterium]
MIAVDVNNVAELHDAGYRVLNEGLGREAARAFLNLSFGGTGNYTEEKKLFPPMTDAEHEEMMAAIIADAKTKGEA